MILVNGVATASLPVSDRGLAYGDGVFRTFAVRNGRVRAWRRQVAKLAADAGALGIPCPGETVLRTEVGEAARDAAQCAVKIIVTRGSGARGYAYAGAHAPTRIVSTSPLPPHPQHWHERGVAVRMCSLRLARQPALAGIKHLNRLENVLARAEWNDPDIAEGLLQDSAGCVIGGTMSNLFLLMRDVLVTPDLSQCGVAGVTRERVIEAARRNGVTCRVAAVSLEELLASTEAFLVNSLIGAWHVRHLGAMGWQQAGMTTTVRRWLDEEEDH
jgi:4-amino-4-deoxychorismate lyase